jgi:hypothetical protein
MGLEYDDVATAVRALRARTPELARGEIARRCNCSAAYVTKVLGVEERHPGARKSRAASATPSVRTMVGMDGATYRALRDAAADHRIGFEALASRILAVALQDGVLRQVLAERADRAAARAVVK